MKLTIISRYPRITLVAMVLFAAGIFAAAVFNEPPDQPDITLAPYTLKNTNLSDGATKAYRTWYENGAWQGDLIEYDIAENGTRYTDVAVGFSPPAILSDTDPAPSDGISNPNDGHINWSARSRFAEAEGQLADGDTSNPIQFDGVVRNETYWQEGDYPNGRRIFTYTGAAQESLVWNSLIESHKIALEGDPNLANDAPVNVAALALTRSPVLEFIRGNRADEFPAEKNFRLRWSILGDIIHSQPVYVKEPIANFTLPYYSTFKTNNSGIDPDTDEERREGRVYVGSNDGMLHAFNAGDGSEVFSYIPSMLLSELPELTERTYYNNHRYFVDGELYAGDVCITTSSTTACTSADSWKTILTGGLGSGGKGLWALDITDPDYTTDKVIAEYSPNTAAGGYDSSLMGYIYNRPQAALFPNKKWYIVTGNGYGSSSQDVGLYLFPLENIDVVSKLVAQDSSGTTNGLSGVTLIDSDGDFEVDTGYAGDLKGNLYKFEFTGTPGTPLSTSNISVTKLIAVGEDKPITTAPDVGRHPNGGYFVYFGTGSAYSAADKANSADIQSIYAVWDKPDQAYPINDTCSSSGGAILCQALSDVLPDTYSYPCGTEESPATCTITYGMRYATQNTPNWSSHRGWRVDLPSGERLLGALQLRAERLQFITTNPTVTDDDGAPAIESWLMGLHWLNGSDGDYPKDVMYDLNKNGDLDDYDGVVAINDLNDDGDTTDPGERKAPVGLNLGPGNLSQPTIARVLGGVDIHFINGLLMPTFQPEMGPLLGGMLDVTTDSPTGGSSTLDFNKLIDEGLTEFCLDIAIDIPISECYGSPATPINGNPTLFAPDGMGIGGLPDGHVHAYDKVHGVSWVDLLNLEPRRDLARLDVYTGDQEVQEGDPWHDDGLVDTTYARLNRLGAWDESSESWETPEPNGFDTDENFIVLVANADLSPGAVIQIGCKTWLIQAYQDMIAGQLAPAGELSTTITPNELTDDEGGTLVFSLNDIRSMDTCDPEDKDYILDMGITKSETPTIRVSFNNRVAQTLGIIPTLPGCVWGIQDPLSRKYDDSAYYTSVEDILLGHLTPVSKVQYCTGNPNPDYIDNFCIDPDDPYADPADADAGDNATGGYRWRNGALTVQLISVGTGGTPINDKLQPSSGTYLTKNNEINDKQYLPIGDDGNLVGGLIAKSFKAKDIDGTPIPDFGDTALLYEAAMFFDAGDYLAWSGGQKVPVCYGSPTYTRQLVQEVIQGMNWGKYQALTEVFFDDGVLNSLYERYVSLWDAVQTATEAEREAALNALAAFLAENPDIALYDKLRNFVGEKVWEQEKNHQERILPIDWYDQGDTDTASDGTPQDVEDISRNLTPVLGPNFITGRRTWIDLRP